MVERICNLVLSNKSSQVMTGEKQYAEKPHRGKVNILNYENSLLRAPGMFWGECKAWNAQLLGETLLGTDNNESSRTRPGTCNCSPDWGLFFFLKEQRLRNDN